MRTTISLPDRVYRKLRIVAREEKRRPNEIIVLATQKLVEDRLAGAERVRRFRAAMKKIGGGLPIEVIERLDGRNADYPRPPRRSR